MEAVIKWRLDASGNLIAFFDMPDPIPGEPGLPGEPGAPGLPGPAGTLRSCLWPEIYRDPSGYSRVLPGNKVSAIPIASSGYAGGGNWPPGYQISSGELDGGKYPAPADPNNGSFPIRIQPPPKGSGLLKFPSAMKIMVDQGGSGSLAKVAFGYGTTATTTGAAKPLSPYLGMHDWEIEKIPAEIIRAGECRALWAINLNAIDPSLNADAKLNWPDWAMKPCENQGRDYGLYPALTALIRVDTPSPVKITGILILGLSI